MRLHDLLEGLDMSELRGAAEVDVRSVVHDSRAARPGALFACIRGAVNDGHAFAAAAVDAGAVALLVEEWVEPPVPQVRVPSVRAALGPLAARFHGDPSRSMRVLGVTGTNGKTTTAHVLESIAVAGGDIAGVLGTVGARIAGRAMPQVHTTPEATELQSLLATMRDERVATVAMEVSSHALDQHRVDGTTFAAVCFTNLSHDHLDYHSTMDEYFVAKARLFDPLFTTQAAVNLDDAYGASLVSRARAAGIDVWTYGLGDVDITARDVVLQARGTTFRLVSTRDGVDASVEFGLAGPYNVHNALAAAATARAADVPFAAVVAGLERPIVVPGRFERVDAGQEFAVIVDYAHTPEALERVLGASRAFTGSSGRVLVVYGCGGDRDRSKRPKMGAVAAALADEAYLTSDNPRSEDPAAIVAEVLAGVPADRQPVVDLDRRSAIRRALGDARGADVVVIAGKGHETGQTARGVTIPFDDRVVAREELEALACR